MKMLNRQTATLDDLCDLVTDGTHDSPKLQEEGVPFIKGKHISSGFVDFENCDFITLEDHQEACKRARPQQHDILFSNIGSVGDTALVKTTREFSIKNVALFRANTSKVLSIYLYYLLMSPEFRQAILNVRSGSAQPFISLANLRAFKVEYFPSLLAQQKILSILSSYDDLIENNLRRIKILEEMAQLLYREWFVHFRFPGHEQVRKVNSLLGKIPENWAIKKLGDAIELLYGKALREEDRKEGDIQVIGSSGVVGRHNEVWEKGPGIVVGRKGNVGSVHWIDADFWPIDTVFCVSTILPLPYVFFNLRSQGFINSDSAVPGLSRNQAYSLPFLCPQESIVNDFAKIVTEDFALISNFKAQNDNLRQSRDLLLPKLISGQLNVADLDIKLSEDIG